MIRVRSNTLSVLFVPFHTSTVHLSSVSKGADELSRNLRSAVLHAYELFAGLIGMSPRQGAQPSTLPDVV
eukprot:352555-Chlamydomonas_euryale.AAC.8